MTIAYESVIRLSGNQANDVIEMIKDKGEPATLEYLKRGFAPGDGTLGSRQWNPWKDTDQVYREGAYVLYYDLDAPYVGLLFQVTV